MKAYIIVTITAVCFVEMIWTISGLPFNRTYDGAGFPGVALLPYVSRRVTEVTTKPDHDLGGRVERSPPSDGDYFCQTLSIGHAPDKLGMWNVVQYEHLKQFILEGVCENIGPNKEGAPCQCAQEHRSQLVLVWRTQKAFNMHQRRAGLTVQRHRRDVGYPEHSPWYINGTALYARDYLPSPKRRLKRAPADKKKRKTKNIRKRSKRVKLDGHQWKFKRFEFRSHCKCQPTNARIL